MAISSEAATLLHKIGRHGAEFGTQVLETHWRLLDELHDAGLIRKGPKVANAIAIEAQVTPEGWAYLEEHSEGSGEQEST